MNSEEHANMDRWAWARIVGLALTLIPLLVRVQTLLAPLPYWDGDPVNNEVIVAGMTPTASLIADLVTILGAALLIGASQRRGTSALVSVALTAVGAWACLWWAPQKSFDPRTAMSVGAWTGGVAAALGLWFAGRDKRVRVLGFAVIAGLIGLLAARGLYECFVQHPTVVADFQKNKARIFAENGWSPESSMAKSFERRVIQSEATGWFGFANVYASFAAMGVTAFGAVLIGAVRARREAAEDGDESAGKWLVLIAAGGLALSGAALVMAGAKGGYAAAVLGLAVVGVLLWLRSERGEKFRRLAWMIGPLAIVAPLLAVVARGAVGEKLGELSILFRWFYMQGAWRIFASHPAHGVGPDGFQAAYSLAKPPLSPEDVTSPHSLLWDWTACLGVGAAAWVVWLVCKSTRIGPTAVADAGGEPTEPGDPIETRTLMRATCLIAAASAFVSIPMQVAMLLPEEALGVRIGGLVIWCVLSCGTLAVARLWSGWVVGLGAGAVVMLAHTQIELTGAVVQSCGLLLALVGLAASGGCQMGNGGSTRSNAGTPSEQARHPFPTSGSERSGAALAPRLLGVVGCLAAVFVLLGTTSAMRRGEVKLKAAYMVLEPVRTTRETLAAAVRDKSPDAPELARKLQQIEPVLMRDAAALLPTTWPSARNASHMAMQVSQAYGSTGAFAQSIAWGVRSVEYGLGVPDEALDRALTTGEISGQAAATAFERLKAAQGGVVKGLNSARAAWVATVYLAAAEKGQAPSARAWQELALPALEQAEALDPYSPFHVQRRMEVLVALGRNDDAKAAAKRLLEVDALQRLDRSVRGLNDRDRSKAERIAAGG